jgi:sulfite exporter TauE/SafE
MTFHVQGFFLGLSSGGACLSMCAPVLVPYLMGEGNGLGRNAAAAGQFLFGRLAGYLCFAVIAWAINANLVGLSVYRDLIMGCTYLPLAVLMILYGFGCIKTQCAAGRTAGRFAGLEMNRRFMFVILLGLLTGLNFCPPFLMAVAGAADTGSLAGSLLFFVAFFAGTLIYFIPAPFIGLIRGGTVMSTVGKMAAGVTGLYYTYAGIIHLVEGVSSQ